MPRITPRSRVVRIVPSYLPRSKSPLSIRALTNKNFWYTMTHQIETFVLHFMIKRIIKHNLDHPSKRTGHKKVCVIALTIRVAHVFTCIRKH